MNIPLNIIRAVLKNERIKYKGVKIQLDHKNEYLDSETDCESSAYFCPDPLPIVKVSTVNRSPNVWLLNVLHETSHVDQWLEESTIWNDCYIDGTDVDTLLNLWVNNKIDLSNPQLNGMLKAVYNLELDAEVRTIKKILKYGLHRYVSIERYTQEAWAYILSYPLLAFTRKWIPANKPPYRVESIVHWMPRTFSGSVPLDWRLIYQKYYPELFTDAQVPLAA